MIDSVDRFTLRHWADGLAVFDRRTGATHCMSPASAAVFERLSIQPATSDEALLAALSACLPQFSEAERRDALVEVRERLRTARLIGP